MFGFFAGIPMVLQQELQGLPGHLKFIDEENAFHDGRATCPFYQFIRIEELEFFRFHKAG
jgi:hypothetical protein